MNSKLHLAAVAAITAALMLLNACKKSNDNIGKDPGTAPDTTAVDTATVDTLAADTVATEYHADADIAMTVRSIADAVAVGEELVAEDYEYHGVLTDGEGKPIYTSPTGAPGPWTVKVASGKAAEITPDMPGNIVAADLQRYVCATLELSDADIVNRPKLHNKNYTDWTVYRIPGGYLCYETAQSTDTRGRESVKLRILITR